MLLLGMCEQTVASVLAASKAARAVSAPLAAWDVIAVGGGAGEDDAGACTSNPGGVPGTTGGSEATRCCSGELKPVDPGELKGELKPVGPGELKPVGSRMIGSSVSNELWYLNGPGVSVVEFSNHHCPVGILMLCGSSRRHSVKNWTSWPWSP